ncbi:MAG: hypothetical protein RLZZ568_501, partial [Cyanobacteriota bacterium]
MSLWQRLNVIVLHQLLGELVQLNTYNPGNFYDELFLAPGQPRPQAAPLIDWMGQLPADSLKKHHETAQIALFNLGVTFRVYSDQQG